jgi:hypothetical protein
MDFLALGSKRKTVLGPSEEKRKPPSYNKEIHTYSVTRAVPRGAQGPERSSLCQREKKQSVTCKFNVK